MVHSKEIQILNYFFLFYLQLHFQMFLPLNAP